MTRKLPGKAVVAGIECNQILHPLPCCGLKCPKNKHHWTEVGDDSSCKSPLSWLKLTSRTTMLLEVTNSSGRPAYNEL
ncbi:hypothetical protein U9M48_025672 [Paspalum notatum var. saurae]|uniref:Uncharacterized protein n=1 Tax=Paspalum notatum var. saurae TaxID=547442 RepID=A0AAQ3WXL0_PASNO